MRTTIAALAALTSMLLVAPAPSATSAGPAERSDRASVPSQRVPSQRVGTLETTRQQVVSLTNARRRAHGCNNLRRNAALDLAAQRHTRRMANANTLSHQLPGESSLGVRVRRAGYNWTLVGENVANGYATPAAVVQGWMNSRGHRRNILNCRFKHIGVGYAVSDRGTPYWTQVFGRR